MMIPTIDELMIAVTEAAARGIRSDLTVFYNDHDHDGVQRA